MSVEKELLKEVEENGQKISPVLPENVKNFLIDIDGTICDDIPNEEPWRMRDAGLYPGALETINKWYDEGHLITFFTSRTEEHRDVTEEWLLSDSQVRNPGLTRQDYERAFAQYLGCNDTIWLGNGCVGDDTHGHVDDIARFVNFDTVLLAYERDPSDANHAVSVDNLARLHAAAEHQPLNVVLLPFPRAVIMNGQRLPASYANFYIANDVVIVPTFNDVNDRLALETIAAVFPDRRVVGLHAVDLVWGLGTLHCLTQQQPAMAIGYSGP